MNPGVNYKIALALCRNKYFANSSFEEIKDCVQDAVMLFLKKELDEVKNNENKTYFWLYHAAILIHKNNAKHERRNTSLDKKQDEGYDVDAKDRAEIDSTILDELNHFLSRVSDEAALIVRMNRLDGYTLEEIATHLGKSLKAIEKKFERTMKKLITLGTQQRERERERERDDSENYFKD